jgi:hypothetical protein
MVCEKINIINEKGIEMNRWMWSAIVSWLVTWWWTIIILFDPTPTKAEYVDLAYTIAVYLLAFSVALSIVTLAEGFKKSN